MNKHDNQALVDSKIGEIITVKGIGSWWFMTKTEIGCKPLTLEDGTIPAFSTEDKAHEWLTK